MRFKGFISTLLLIILSHLLLGQDLDHYCSTDEMVQNSFHDHPEYKVIYDKMNDFAKKYTKEHFRPNDKGPICQIPVVFHIIHNFGSENISRQQVINGLAAMNARWRKTDPDTSQIVAPFNQIYDDIEVEFVLAKKDKNGNCIDGITRHVSIQTFGASDGVKHFTDEKLDYPYNMYLNVWVARSMANGSGGYSYYPGTAPSLDDDGIMVRSSQLSALAHEAGHWMNLGHLWGNSNNNNQSGNCNTDDSVDDTPNTMGQSFCSTSRNSCSDDPIPFLDLSGNVLWPAANGEIHDNAQNVMDYGFCSAENFTQGQKARVHAVFASGIVQRDNLISASNHIATGINSGFTCVPAPVVDFDKTYEYVCTESNSNQIMVNNCYNSASMTYNWSFENGTSSNPTSKNASAIWSTPGLYDVTLSATSNGGTTTLTETDFITVISGRPTEPFKESFGSSIFPINNVNNFKDDWFIDNMSTSTTSWDRTEITGYNSKSSLVLDIKKSPGTHRLISPLFDMGKANCDSISFRVAYAKRVENSVDKLRIKISRTCGKNWPFSDQIVELIASDMETTSPIILADYTPSNTDWKRFSYSLKNFSFSDIIVMFEFESGNGNTIYLDDINIGCSNRVASPDNIFNKNEIQFRLYPNPTSNDANIEITSNEVSNQITITDITGKIITNTYIINNGNAVNTSISNIVGNSLSNGVYFVTVGNSKSSRTQKLIVD